MMWESLPTLIRSDDYCFEKMKHGENNYRRVEDLK